MKSLTCIAHKRAFVFFLMVGSSAPHLQAAELSSASETDQKQSIVTQLNLTDDPSFMVFHPNKGNLSSQVQKWRSTYSSISLIPQTPMPTKVIDRFPFLTGSPAPSPFATSSSSSSTVHDTILFAEGISFQAVLKEIENTPSIVHNSFSHIVLNNMFMANDEQAVITDLSTQLNRWHRWWFYIPGAYWIACRYMLQQYCTSYIDHYRRQPDIQSIISFHQQCPHTHLTLAVPASNRGATLNALACIYYFCSQPSPSTTTPAHVPTFFSYSSRTPSNIIPYDHDNRSTVPEITTQKGFLDHCTNIRRENPVLAHTYFSKYLFDFIPQKLERQLHRDVGQACPWARKTRWLIGSVALLGTAYAAYSAMNKYPGLRAATKAW